MTMRRKGKKRIKVKTKIAPFFGRCNDVCRSVAPSGVQFDMRKHRMKNIKTNRLATTSATIDALFSGKVHKFSFGHFNGNTKGVEGTR